MFLKYLGFGRSKNTSSSKRHYPTVIEELCHQFSLEDLRKSTNNFDKKLVIGRGGFGTVYKGYLKHNGSTDYTIAIKRFDRSSRQGFLEFQKEIESLCQLHHPNLVSLIGFCNHEKEKILVYEYMPNGSLDVYLLNRDMEPLSWKKRIEICIGAARGVHYLHTGVKRSIFHRDIKPSNILLDDNMVPKLSDFGLSLQGPLSMSKPKIIEVDRIVGTYGYMANEYALYGRVTDKCDVYSFGVVLLHVACTEVDTPHFVLHILQELPIPIEEMIDPILNGKIAPECWELFADIVHRCLKHEPDERPTMGEVEVLLEHALSLQEEADIRKTDDDYTLPSTTYIDQKWPLFTDDPESDPSICGDCSSSSTTSFDAPMEESLC